MNKDGGSCALCGREPLCGGLGLISYDVDVSDPRFGRLFRCPNNPLEHDAERRERLRSLSNLGAFAGKTFDSFRSEGLMLTPYEQQSLQTARQAAQRYAESPDGWLLLAGGYGCGKTHLAAAVANAHRERFNQPGVLFVTVADLFDYLRQVMGGANQSLFEQRFRAVRDVPLLILDDLGGDLTAFWKDKLFQLLDYRYPRVLPTVITTARPIEELDRRLVSRLLDTRRCALVAITAPSYAARINTGRSSSWR